jgi:uroporphyrinogen decarboxylase
MTPKERILAILNRQPVDRIPVDIWHTGEIAALLRQHCGADNDLDAYEKLGLDKIVWVFLGPGPNETAERNLWGVPTRSVRAGAATYAEFAEAPLAAFDTPASLDDYPWWPDIEKIDYAGAAAKARAAAERFAVIGPWVSFFEIYCQMRGLEQAMCDLVENEDFVEAALDRIEETQTKMMRRFFTGAGGSLDLVFVSDDIATQQSLLLSPAAWERHLRPRMKRWCDFIHAHGLRVFYHTDGAARPLLRPIIDCGVDVLNPIQHVCTGMDMAELKKEFGGRVIFHGGVDNQFALPRGTPDDVRAETRACLRSLGAGRQGYICASCHNLQAGTPIENILAMIETVRSEG